MPDNRGVVYAIQGRYAFGWEDVTEETDWLEAKARRREYRENEPGTVFRIVRRRAPMRSAFDTTVERMVSAYIACALWSSLDDAGEPLDARFSDDDLTPEARAKMRADCDSFYSHHHTAIDQRPHNDAGNQAGHDFWLTRNGHGAGFWDGDWPDAIGKRLTAASRRFGECSLVVGDDGRLHHEP